MQGPKMLFERDREIDKVLQEISKILAEMKIQKDSREQWFANTQLNNTRQLLEVNGYKTARLFLSGKLEKGGRREDKALLNILNVLANSSLEVSICSYIIGKLNPIIDEFKKRGGKDVQRNQEI